MPFSSVMVAIVLLQANKAGGGRFVSRGESVFTEADQSRPAGKGTKIPFGMPDKKNWGRKRQTRVTYTGQAIKVSSILAADQPVNKKRVKTRVRTRPVFS